MDDRTSAQPPAPVPEFEKLEAPDEAPSGVRYKSRKARRRLDPATSPFTRNRTGFLVYLTRSELDAAGEEARRMGMSRSAWVAALIRRRTTGQLSFVRQDELALISTLGEIQRIRILVVEMARAASGSAIRDETRPPDVQGLNEVCAKLDRHILTLQKAFAGNLAYFDTGHG